MNPIERAIRERRSIRAYKAEPIAEEDLKLRGPGEVFGTAQSGYFALNIADLSRDKEILKTARYDALCQLKQRNP